MDLYSSFEQQLMEIDISFPLLCAVVYHPANRIKDFIKDIFDVLAGLMLVGDFLRSF